VPVIPPLPFMHATLDMCGQVCWGTQASAPIRAGGRADVSPRHRTACVGDEQGRGCRVSGRVVPVCGHVLAGVLCAPVGALCPCARAHVAEVLLHAHPAGTGACKQKN